MKLGAELRMELVAELGEWNLKRNLGEWNLKRNLELETELGERNLYSGRYILRGGGGGAMLYSHLRSLFGHV